MEKSDTVILIADDNNINLTILQKMLDTMGYVCDTVLNGQEAVDAAAKKRYDIIMMDIQMPIMDGVTATKEILANTDEQQRPLIVAVTASNMAYEIAAYDECGMFAILPKPFRLKDLKELISRCECHIVNRRSINVK